MWSAIFVISTSWRWDVFLKIWVTMSGKEKIKQNTQNRLEYDSLNDSKKPNQNKKKLLKIPVLTTTTKNVTT